MAVYQATGRPAVSLPNGCRSFPTDILVLMERFDTVHIWMDNDGPGREGAETFAKKLGVEQGTHMDGQRRTEKGRGGDIC
jgi:twinkle protein